MRNRILMAACVAALLGCSDDGTDSNTGSIAGAAGDGEPVDASAQCPPGLPTFATGPSGLQARDEKSGLAARIISSSASPPEKDFNDWTIALTDANGAPATTATLTWACAWMDVHGHGTNPKRVDVKGNGEFLLFHQNLSMYGPWQVRLWVDPTGAGAAYAPQSVSGVANGNACTGPNALAQPNLKFDICVPRTR